MVLVQQLWTFLSDKLVNAPQAGEMRVYQLVALGIICFVSTYNCVHYFGIRICCHFSRHIWFILDSILPISSAVEGDEASKQVAADPP